MCPKVIVSMYGLSDWDPKGIFRNLCKSIAERFPFFSQFSFFMGDGSITYFWKDKGKGGRLSAHRSFVSMRCHSMVSVLPSTGNLSSLF